MNIRLRCYITIRFCVANWTELQVATCKIDTQHPPQKQEKWLGIFWRRKKDTREIHILPWVPLPPSGEMTSTNVKMPGVCSSSTVLRLEILYGFFGDSLATSANSPAMRGDAKVEFHDKSTNSISIWVTLMECSKCGVTESWSSAP